MKYVCEISCWVHDEETGCLDMEIESGTKFEDCQMILLFELLCRNRGFYKSGDKDLRQLHGLGIQGVQKSIGNKIMTKTIFNLLYWSGMRSGELLALTLRDFDFEARTVTIDKNYARLDKQDLILEPKTPKSNRTIGIPKTVCDMVKDYASRLMDYEPNERLFDVTKGFLYYEMERISKESGSQKNSCSRYPSQQPPVC